MQHRAHNSQLTTERETHERDEKNETLAGARRTLTPLSVSVLPRAAVAMRNDSLCKMGWDALRHLRPALTQTSEPPALSLTRNTLPPPLRSGG